MKNKTTENIPTNHNHSHSGTVFDNIDMFVKKFDDPTRDEWQKPDEVIMSLNLSDDAIVVEIGAGTGYFAVRLAKHVPKGKVLCFDHSSNMVSYLQDRANKLGLSNIEVCTTKADGSFELKEKADLIFSVDVYHHLQDRISYFSKIAQHLKPEGMLVVIDRTEERVEGQPKGHRVPKEKIKEELKYAGFYLTQELDLLLPVQYYLAFKKIY